MKYFSCLLLLFTILLVAGCQKTKDTPEPQVQEIFPMKVGNKWYFHTVRNDSTSTNHVNEVIKDTLINSQTWYVLTYDSSIRTYCQNTSRGWWFIYSENPDMTLTAALYYLYPAKVNDQYLTIDSTLVTVVSIDEKVSVYAGTFTCYHYHMIHYRESYECEEYFAPGTGFIKHVVYEPSSGTSRVFETTTLTATNVKGK